MWECVQAQRSAGCSRSLSNASDDTFSSHYLHCSRTIHLEGGVNDSIPKSGVAELPDSSSSQLHYICKRIFKLGQSSCCSLAEDQVEDTRKAVLLHQKVNESQAYQGRLNFPKHQIPKTTLTKGATLLMQPAAQVRQEWEA